MLKINKVKMTKCRDTSEPVFRFSGEFRVISGIFSTWSSLSENFYSDIGHEFVSQIREAIESKESRRELKRKLGYNRIGLKNI